MILIIGSNGQLGQQMQKVLGARDIPYSAYDYPDIDITRNTDLEKLIEQIKPHTVVNCAAYTNVDRAESDYDNAYQVNAIGPKYLAEICERKNLELIHISTDYVFSGVPVIENGYARAYIETDKCAPVTVYGKTKYEGERFIMQGCSRYYILRTAWLYGDGNNFVRTMLKLAETNNTIRVVNDQFGSPTSTIDLAEAICTLIATGEYGLYHATCEGQCSWFEFAKKIFEIKKIDIDVKPISSEEFTRPAKRPTWSVLENAMLKQLGANEFRPWDDSLAEYLK